MVKYAHSLSGRPYSDWQDLETHLTEVAALATDFADPFSSSEWARLAGLLHDIGKGSTQFQDYLKHANDPDATAEEQPGRVDHSTAGAQMAVAHYPLLGHLIAFAVAGHHSGLLDTMGHGASLEARLTKKIPPLPEIELTLPEKIDPPLLLQKLLAKRDAFGIAFFVRMIFSALTDADYLNTESFMDPERYAARLRLPLDTLQKMSAQLSHYIDSLLATASAEVLTSRREVRNACRASATEKPGFFSLTVPTGGGKTLSSLEFALNHAITHNLKRIIYVLPFTTIIEQNAAVFRRALEGIEGIDADSLIIEHHSNFDHETASKSVRLASENWDAKLIVTTTVQFYESLFAARPSKCRKLHNLSESVIILDEAQTIPTKLLEPTLRALQELVDSYSATLLFCTATQPAIESRDEFPIGIEKSRVREIIPDPPKLYRRLKRVSTTNLGAQSDDELVHLIEREEQVLCIVKTTGHASLLSQKLADSDALFHLSSRMCPVHRHDVLNEVKQRLSEKQPCRLISTTLIEAGVDIDFPVVLRAITGIDSIAQAAGRCNRNGLLPTGKLYLFEPEHLADLRFMADMAGSGVQILSLYPDDPLSLDAIEHYFKLHFWQRQSEWDSYNIMKAFKLDRQNPNLPFNFAFATAAKEYTIIKEQTFPIIIPYDKQGKELCEELRHMPFLSRTMARKAQQYTVAVRFRAWHENLGCLFEPFFENSLAILTSSELNYNRITGLQLEMPPHQGFFC